MLGEVKLTLINLQTKRITSAWRSDQYMINSS